MEGDGGKYVKRRRVRPDGPWYVMLELVGQDAPVAYL